MTDRQHEIERIAANVQAQGDQLAAGLSEFLLPRVEQLDELAETLRLVVEGIIPEFVVTAADAAALSGAAMLAAGIARSRHASQIAEENHG